MIFYFSATGNCLYTAQKLAEATGDTLVPIMDALKGECSYDLKDDEMVGIVTPVYFYGLPLFVEDLISKMRFNTNPSVYLVLTYGTYTGTTSKQAVKKVANAGYSLDYTFSVKMPENYIILMKAPDDENEKKILADADRKIDTIIKTICAKEKGDHDDGKGSAPFLLSSFSRPLYKHGRSTGKFYTTGMCSGCGKCSKICPVGAIEMVDRIPTWTKKKCYRCMACVSRCPAKAIEFGRSTKGKKRYVNPNVRFP